jgi:hypothetical protein
MTFPAGESYTSNIDVIGYDDVDGRPAFKLALHKSADDRWYLYTGQFWCSGFSIIEVTDPANPRFVRYIEGPPNTWTLQVQVADNLLVTSQEKIMDGWGHIDGQPWGEGMIIWDLTDPENPEQLSHWKTGGYGTHRNYYDGGRYIYATGLPEGYEGNILQIVDIEDPRNPVEVGRWWMDGQHVAGGEAGAKPGTMLHGGAYVKGDLAYLPYSAGGFVVLDISDKTNPTLVGDLPFSPPFQTFIAVHTAVPLQGRDLVIVNSEAIKENCDEPLGYAGIVDVSDNTNPRLMSLFPLPVPPAEAPYPTFCARGGRFGPHNQHQPQYQDILYQGEDLCFLTYFNAGLRVYDISNAEQPREVGYFLPPDPLERRGLLPASKLVAQTEDVIVDARGNIFVSDKNHGIYVLRYNGLNP